MKRSAVMLAVIVGVGIALALIGSRSLNAQQEPLKRTMLLRTDLKGLEGKESVVLLVELAPGAVTGKHYHSGNEVNYDLDRLRGLGDRRKAADHASGGDNFPYSGRGGAQCQTYQRDRSTQASGVLGCRERPAPHCSGEVAGNWLPKTPEGVEVKSCIGTEVL